jgi:hypothetical protein
MRYILLLLGLCVLSAANAQTPTGGLPEQPTDIGYPTPAAALKALRAKPGVTIREQNDWYILDDPSDHTIWSIAEPTNPAYPTAVKRTIVQDAVGIHLRTRMICGASKQICDQVAMAFKQLNAEARQAVQHQAMQN